MSVSRAGERSTPADWMQWVMLVAGGLTSTMLYAAIAPDAALLSSFGASLDGPVADIVVRNWGALIGLIGAMLIYGAFDRPSRPLILVVAGISKLTFIALVLSYGAAFLHTGAGMAVAVDLAMVVTFVWYLIAARSSGHEDGAR